LTDAWPVLTIIQEKLNNPSADDPFEPDIAAVSLFLPNDAHAHAFQLLKNDKAKFLQTAKEWTKK